MKDFCENGHQLAIVRRWDEDFRGKRGAQMWDALVANDLVRKYSKGKWTDIYYYSGRWWLCKYENEDRKGKSSNHRVVDERPLAYGFAITTQEHDKSTSYPGVKTILFDEFISRGGYATDEFVLFQNTCSTIIRERGDVTIYMMGNTVNRYCPYFAEMGLIHVKDQKQGTIDIYKYGEKELSVAVEYCDNNEVSKPSDKYFAFDNPRLKMITEGTWEIDVYPHLPSKYSPKDVVYRYYIKWEGDLLQCEVIARSDTTYTYVHRWTSEINDPIALVFGPEHHDAPQYRRKINVCPDNIGRRVWDYWQRDKVYFADNLIGEICRNYLQWCGSSLLG